MDDKHKEAMREKLHDLSIFMQHYGVPKSLQRQVFHYYGHILNQRISENDTKMIQELPPALRHELEVFMNVKLINGVPLFKNCPSICLKEVASSLEQNFFSPGEFIVRKGEIGAEMFLIGHGEVDVLDDDANVIATLKEGQFFGEIALLKTEKRIADVRAKSYCDLYILTKDNFIPILNRYPILEKNIKSVVLKRSNDRSTSKKAS
jgi:voltage-gated potassium channel